MHKGVLGSLIITKKLLVSKIMQPTLSLTGSDVPGTRQPKLIGNVYIEKHLGFRAEPSTEYERRMTEKQKVLQAAARHQIHVKQNNPGLSFALNIHGAIDRFGRTITGLFAGAALVHTLFVQSLRFTRHVQNSGVVQYDTDNGLQLLMRYGLYTEAIYITYYIAFILTGLFAFERFDIGRPTNKCIMECVTLAVSSPTKN